MSINEVENCPVATAHGRAVQLLSGLPTSLLGKTFRDSAKI